MDVLNVLDQAGLRPTSKLKLGVFVKGRPDCIPPAMVNRQLCVVELLGESELCVFFVLDGNPHTHYINLRDLMIVGSPAKRPDVGTLVITCPNNTKGLAPFKFAEIESVRGKCDEGMPLTCQLRVKFEKQEACEVELGLDVVVVSAQYSVAAQCRM
tara:strand:- start:382 stop:849 length:468 start_codon:yes stop_codon:yes gene_type:complete